MFKSERVEFYSFPLYLIMAVESVNYDSAVRGYHVYKSVWEPKERPFLSCSHEENDIYDMFAIKTCLTDETGKEQIVGHLPLELSRFTKYLLDSGAVVTAKLTSTHYRRSVLVQGAEMIATEKNKRILAHYLEIIFGSFLASENRQELEAGICPDFSRHTNCFKKERRTC